MERAEMVRRGAEAAWRVDWPGAEWEFASLSAEDREWYGQLAKAVLVEVGAIPLGGYTRTAPDPDDMDGGVTAALIEQEAEKPDLSVDYHAMWWKAEREREKAERERDECQEACQAAEDRAVLAEARLAEAEQDRDELVDVQRHLTAHRAFTGCTDEDRPLLPAMLDRLDKLIDHAADHDSTQASLAKMWRDTAMSLHDMAVDAERERDEARGALRARLGAEELRPILVEFARMNAARAGTGDELDLADFLAERGVRAPEDGAA